MIRTLDVINFIITEINLENKISIHKKIGIIIKKLVM